MNIKFNYAAISLIALVSLISYANIFQNEFVWDDHVFILENSDIRSFSSIPLFFTKDADGLYRPLRTLHYAIIYSFAGKSEFWYHFNSIFLHTIISILVFLIIEEVLGTKGISLASALIFASHPIHTERVTNMTGGFDLLGIFFMLASFYFYIKFSKYHHKKSLLFSLLLFLIAVFSSEEALMLPLLIILYEFCFKKEGPGKELIKSKIAIYAPYFAIALLYAAIRFFALGIRGRIENYLAGSFYLTMLTMLKAYAYYIYLLFFPANLTVYHEIKAAASLLELKVIISALILSAIIFFAVKNYKNKVLFFSVFWFFITLLPFSNILPLQAFIAERYLYLPSIGFSLLASYFLFQIYNFKRNPTPPVTDWHSGKSKNGFSRFASQTIARSLRSLGRISKNANIPNVNSAFNHQSKTERIFTFNLGGKKILHYSAIAFIAILLGLYAARTIDRNNDWKDDLSLWAKTVKTSPGSSRAHDNLGFTYERMGKTKEALQEFEKAVALQADNFDAMANLGVAYAKSGMYNESLAALKKSIEIKKDHKTYDKLGLVYAEMRMNKEAIESFNEAIKIYPRYAKAHNDLAVVHGRTGKFELALDNFNKAIKIDWDYADAHYNLGILLEYLGQKEKAKEEFEIAARLEPENELYAKKRA